MTNLPQLRLIHLSDLHFGRNHICAPEDTTGASRGIPPLKELLQRDLASPDWGSTSWAIQSPKRPPTPLLIIATGDLTQGADASEFDQVHDLLSTLVGQEQLGSKIDLRHVFVVPGNHDVVFDKDNPEHRFAPYCQFYNKLFREIQPTDRPYVRPEESHGLNRIHAFPESQFLVAEINSCYYVERETIDESRGQVDAGAIAELRSALEIYGTECDEWIKIAIIHHHPVLLPSFIEPGRGVDSVLNARSLLRLLRDNGFQLVLHGHKHYPQVFSYDPESAWATSHSAIPQLIIAGGSCGSRELPAATQQCNTYNLLTVKWNPRALQARVQIVTRGLTRTGPDADLDPDQWSWKTLRVFDKGLSLFKNFPAPKSSRRVTFPEPRDAFEDDRDNQYKKLRQNMPVVEVVPSLMPGQGYEACAWLVPHRYHKESPVRVIWSAGPLFNRKIVEADAAPDFAVTFQYYGPMLIQAVLEFANGEKALTYVYARLPDARLNQ